VQTLVEWVSAQTLNILPSPVKNTSANIWMMIFVTHVNIIQRFENQVLIENMIISGLNNLVFDQNTIILS